MQKEKKLKKNVNILWEIDVHYTSNIISRNWIHSFFKVKHETFIIRSFSHNFRIHYICTRVKFIYKGKRKIPVIRTTDTFNSAWCDKCDKVHLQDNINVVLGRTLKVYDVHFSWDRYKRMSFLLSFLCEAFIATKHLSPISFRK